MSASLVALGLTQDANFSRADESRGIVAAMYLLIAVGMLCYSTICGILYSYALPAVVLKRLTEGVRASLFVIIVTVLFFTVSAAGGLTGWLTMSLLMLILLVVALVRAILARNNAPRLGRRRKRKPLGVLADEDEDHYEEPEEAERSQRRRSSFGSALRPAELVALRSEGGYNVRSEVGAEARVMRMERRASLGHAADGSEIPAPRRASKRRNSSASPDDGAVSNPLVVPASYRKRTVSIHDDSEKQQQAETHVQQTNYVDDVETTMLESPKGHTAMSSLSGNPPVESKGSPTSRSVSKSPSGGSGSPHSAPSADVNADVDRSQYTSIFGEVSSNPDAVLEHGSHISRRSSKAARKSLTTESSLEKDLRNRHIVWGSYPEKMSPRQWQVPLLIFILQVGLLIALISIFFTWDIPPYQVIERDGVLPVVEVEPEITKRSLQLLYAYERVATVLRLNPYVTLLTSICGTEFTRPLNLEGRRTQIKEKWIDKYMVNQSLYEEPNAYWAYPTVNDWFIRPINKTYRPIPPYSRGWARILSPADCRMLIYLHTDFSRVWVKGHMVDVYDLIGNIPVNGVWNYFASSTMVIARLAPQDYHRFHAPTDAIVKTIHIIEGTLWSVSYVAARSGNDAFLNTRKVVIFDGGPTIGHYAFVAIGATCVGSVVLRHSDGRPLLPGDTVQAGDEIGYMQFGGSTIVMLFQYNPVAPPGEGIRWDQGMLTHSQYPVETRVVVNSLIGLQLDP